jgi:hypothetical protein
LVSDSTGLCGCVAGEAHETLDRLPTAAATTRKANAVSSCVDRRCFIAW